MKYHHSRTRILIRIVHVLCYGTSDKLKGTLDKTLADWAKTGIVTLKSEERS